MRITDLLPTWFARSARARRIAQSYIRLASKRRRRAADCRADLDALTASVLTDAWLMFEERRALHSDLPLFDVCRRCLSRAASEQVRLWHYAEEHAVDSFTTADVDANELTWQEALGDELTKQRQDRLRQMYAACDTTGQDTLRAVETALRTREDNRRKMSWSAVYARRLTGIEIAPHCQNLKQRRKGVSANRAIEKLRQLRPQLVETLWRNYCRSITERTGNPLDRLRSTRACFATRSTLPLREDLPSQTCTQEQNRRRERAIVLAQYRRQQKQDQND